jgi:uncharacterized OsmC-like protein
MDSATESGTSVNADLKSVLSGMIAALQEHPTAGQGTAITRTKIRDGTVTCDIEDGDWRFIADEMPEDGGSGLGPDPGVFGRAALGSCLAMGYVVWAAHLDIPIEDMEVVVEADYDARGMVGIDDAVTPGWSAVRYRVLIKSPAPEERILEMVELADRYSSILDAFRRPLNISRELVVS